MKQKVVSCPVHGSIRLEEAELAILETPEFRRLAGVSQLGMASTVFPSSNYSRLSHCIGASHVAGRILATLKANDSTITDEEVRTCRVAALLHDVGHYPFSHTMERAVKEFAAKSKLVSEGDPVDVFKHEELGAEIITNIGSQIYKVLHEQSIDPEKIRRLILNKDTEDFDLRLANVVASDLDADRIDYLLRTSHHTGVPYGKIDSEYLITMMRLDSKNRLCLDRRAKRTAEHLLMARYFDYQQISYHKTVASYELLLERIVLDLLGRGDLQCSKQSIQASIETGTFAYFDDRYLIERIRNRAVDGDEFCEGFLKRRGPKLLGHLEVFYPLETSKGKSLQDDSTVKSAVKQLAAEEGLSDDNFFHWSKEFHFTSFSATVGREMSEQEKRAEVSVRIVDQEEILHHYKR